MAEIAEITRTYGGIEGRRVKQGTRFGIGKPVSGLQTITTARFQQLADAGLARRFDPKAGPAPTPAYGGGGGGQKVTQKQPNTSRTVRKAIRKNADRPDEPRPLVNPAAGGPIGAVGSAALSPEAQASLRSNLGLRGRRRSQSSRSITPGNDSPGLSASTPATVPGGESTTGQKDSTA